MRAFILRRVELIAAGVGDIVFGRYTADQRVSDAQWTAIFLHRSRTRPESVQNLLDSFQISASEIPVLICRGQIALRNPTNQEIADCLGFNESIDQTHVRDLVSKNNNNSLCYYNIPSAEIKVKSS